MRPEAVFERFYLTAVAGYVSISFLLVSLLHSVYIYFRFGTAVLGIPFSEPRITVPAMHSVIGDIVISLVAFGSIFWLLNSNPRPNTIEKIDAIVLGFKYMLLSGALLLLSQLISASSWSKLALQAFVLLLAAYLISLPIENPTIRSIILFYISITITLVGIGVTWLELWVGRVNLPKSPATAYYLSSLFIVLFPSISLTIVWINPDN